MCEIRTHSLSLEDSHATVNTYSALVEREVIETSFLACKARVIAIILTSRAGYTRIELVSPDRQSRRIATTLITHFVSLQGVEP